MTLIEVLVTTGVSMLVIAAAATALMQMSRINREGDERSAVDMQLRIALTLLERSLSNTALSFPAPQLAFRLYNNIGAGALTNGDVAGGGSGNALSVVDGTAEGIVSGTDVVEIAYGDTRRRRPGQVADCPGGACASGSVLGTANLVSQQPFTVEEATALVAAGGTMAGPLLLFVNPAAPAQSCLARATSFAPGNNTVTLTFVNLDLTPTVQAGCPAPGWDVYALDVRQRFMIYQLAGGEQRGLYLQENEGPDAPGFADEPMLIAAGIEDLQVSPRLIEPPPGGVACPTPPALCLCNTTPTPAAPPTNCVVNWGASNPSQAGELVRGARVVVTGVGAPDWRVSQGRRPAVLDHPAGPVDSRYYATADTTVVFMNLLLGQL